MATSAGGNGDTLEINLTPLLDVVLQLIMFFMITFNQANEQANPYVELAPSISATELPKKTPYSYTLVVNLEKLRVRDDDHPKARTESEMNKLLARVNKFLIDQRLIPNYNPIKLEEVKQGRVYYASFMGTLYKTEVIFRETEKNAGMRITQRLLQKQVEDIKTVESSRLDIQDKEKIKMEDLKAAVVLRPDKECDWEMVVRLIGQCTDKKFVVQTRALTKMPGAY